MEFDRQEPDRTIGCSKSRFDAEQTAESASKTNRLRAIFEQLFSALDSGTTPKLFGLQTFARSWPSCIISTHFLLPGQAPPWLDDKCPSPNLIAEEKKIRSIHLVLGG